VVYHHQNVRNHQAQLMMAIIPIIIDFTHRFV
jgi:hypothetical protein